MAREPESDSDTEQGVILVLTLLLLSNLPRPELIRRVTATLERIEIPTPAIAELLGMPDEVFRVAQPSAPKRSARRVIQRGRASRRAMYITAAAKRLGAGGSPAAERRLFGAHKAAEHRREQAGWRIDQEVKAHGPTLGWYAKRDEKTTPLCRAAHGRNFSATSPPEIGWPGTIHAGQCRCLPGPPWPEGTMLP